jgi:hypothetical protein
MHSQIITNLWILAQALWKFSWMTGLGPGFAAIATWEIACRRIASRERKLYIVRKPVGPEYDANLRKRELYRRRPALKSLGR